MAPSLSTLTPRELAERLDGGPARVLDVRSPAEFEEGRIPGSYNIPLPDLAPHAARLAISTDPLVLVCRSGARARQAAAMWPTWCSSVHVLEGGIAAWLREGHAVDEGRRGWAMERQVRLSAGALVIAGLAAGLRHPGARFLSAGVGVGLVFSAVTDTCGMAHVLARLPINRARRDQVEQAMAALEPRPAVGRPSASASEPRNSAS